MSTEERERERERAYREQDSPKNKELKIFAVVVASLGNREKRR